MVKGFNGFSCVVKVKEKQMKQSELIEAIAENSTRHSPNGISKTVVEAVLKTQAEVVHAYLSNGGDELTIPGLVKIHKSQRKARTGRNPKTGEAIHIHAKNTAAFTALKALKDAVS